MARYSSSLTSAESTTAELCYAAEARLAGLVAELAGQIATEALARSGRDAMAFAVTGRRDWGHVGDMQNVLQQLIEAGVGLGLLSEDGEALR